MVALPGHAPGRLTCARTRTNLRGKDARAYLSPSTFNSIVRGVHPLSQGCPVVGLRQALAAPQGRATPWRRSATLDIPPDIAQTVLSVLSDAAQLAVLVVGRCITRWVILSLPVDLGSAHERAG